ncbi:bifunctional demethylmenaquinone methyltransferase/2-methoxy-6-polyprenyl-1,4-benzoquinol methylase UbiE [Prochlorococcus marinus]|uniref:2-phytyl-1,4-naphtoquinone methyltransferase n=1 Tax=Prochlorococcus marinus (strain MIT 9211) TaxID=93059 RepID=A9BE48_PROM4|nr:bifunctional demethylmenaquinone methyltransferase/2-methoxy-6-polyprenyl-1,4-benzoquinol methylase UbiE [Prochlorococcus marinus]ABX08358.1 Ubiquinone/menaquinone biosynthesis methyltransferase [Prochlorococcus marinus str. MIT 9211]
MRPKDSLPIKELFDTVSPTYDFLNDLFSFGLHRLWKRQFLRWLNPTYGENWADLCCGTGDLSISLAKLLGPNGSVLGIDFSSSQIALAKKRAFKASIQSVSWLEADVLDNQLQSSSFDGVVMAYGLRNLSDPASGLHHMQRLLKPGGRAGVLDFNHTREGSLSSVFQKCYLRKFVVPLASTMGLREEYSYLEESLKSFPTGSLQKDMAISVGFKKASYRLIAGAQMGALLLQA